MPILLVLAAMLAARSARADQCQWLADPAIATRAARELASHPEIVTFCEPCGDAAPGAPRKATNVAVQQLGDHATSITIDGESVDLAYTYVKTSERQYRNLAALAGCATSGVSPSLRVDAATAAGVLIRADPGAPAAAMPAMPAMSPPEPPAAAAPAIYVVSSSPSGWIGWLLGYSALFATLCALVMWRVARRRTAHVPRATKLEPPR